MLLGWMKLANSSRNLHLSASTVLAWLRISEINIVHKHCRQLSELLYPRCRHVRLWCVCTCRTESDQSPLTWKTPSAMPKDAWGCVRRGHHMDWRNKSDVQADDIKGKSRTQDALRALPLKHSILITSSAGKTKPSYMMCISFTTRWI